MIKESRGGGDAKPIAIYENLRRDGLHPSISIALAALKVCAGSEYLATGAGIHADLANRWTGSVYVANNIIAMYARCGSMDDARLVFQSMEQLAMADLVSWNSIIQGYCDNGDFESALRWFVRLEESDGFRPDGRSVVAALKACSSIAGGIEKERQEGMGREDVLDDRRRALLEKVRCIHRDARDRRCSRDGFVANALIESYGKCGSLEEALIVFESMEAADLASSTSIIVQCVENGEAAMAIEIFDRMESSGIRPDDRAFVAVLKAYEALLDQQEQEDEEQMVAYLEKIRELHSRSGSEMDLFLGNTLIGAYARAGDLDDAREVFDKIKLRDAVSWTKMLLGYLDAGKPDLALDLYSRMRNDGSTAPSGAAAIAALKACSKLACDEEATMIDRKLVKIDALEKGMAVLSDQASLLKRDSFVANSAMEFYSKCRDLDLARWVFDGIQNRTIGSWNSMIAGYVENDEPEMALELYAAMKNNEETIVPNKISVLAALKACGNLAADQRVKNLERVLAIHSQALRSGTKIDAQLGSSLIEAYSKCGSLRDARSIFQQMGTETRDAVAWNSIILACVESGAAEQGLELYLEMRKQSRCSPNRGTYIAALRACGTLAAMEAGTTIHDELRAAKMDRDTKMANALVDFYGKCGSPSAAHRCFDDFPVESRSLGSWNSLIAAYGNAGEAGRVVKLLETMIQDKIEPDSATFAAVLSACSHAGLVEQGKVIFESMSSEFGIEPSIEHWSCWINLLCRVNRIEEAVKVVTEKRFCSTSLMACSSSLAKLWMAILCACYKSGNVETAKIAFKALMELDDREAGAYVAIANMFQG